MCKRAGIELDDFEALFGGREDGIDEMMPSAGKRNKADYPVIDIAIKDIDSFPNHPFMVVDDEEMALLAENIAELWHGDCLELMKNIPDGSVDLALTDPPYGTTACKSRILPISTHNTSVDVHNDY